MDKGRDARQAQINLSDIYSNKENIGRGGWTWYTGSASWAYKIGVEEIIGLKKEGNKLRIDPKIDASWDSFDITYRYYDTLYNITVLNESHINHGVKSITLDDKITDDNIITLDNDKVNHKIIVNMKEDL
jgi:cyclic beta-1,2-glucan synthetase